MDLVRCVDCHAVWESKHCPAVDVPAGSLEADEAQEYEAQGTCPDCGGWVAYGDEPDPCDEEPDSHLEEEYEDRYLIDDEWNPGSPYL